MVFALSQHAYNVTVSGKDRHTAGICGFVMVGIGVIVVYLQSAL